MRDLAVRRVRRVVASLAEPSGWRSLQVVFGKARTNKLVNVPSSGPIDKIVPSAPRSLHKIPPIIFQTWKSRHEIPENFRYWRQTFVDLNPEAQVILWNDEDNRAFVAEMFPWFLPTYDAFPREIFRADAVRYLFLFHFGGLYADMDSECLKPLKLTHRKEAVLLGRMGCDTGFEHSVPNALMASRPRQAFWLLVIQRMLDASIDSLTAESEPGAGPEELTGPILLKRSFDEYETLSQTALVARISPVLRLLSNEQKRVQFSDVTLLDRNSWYPLDWTNPFHKQLRNHLDRSARLLPPETARWVFPRAELVTYWSHSW